MRLDVFATATLHELERARGTTGDVLQIDDGALYPALHRLEDRGWILADWGVSDNNRKAKFYELTARGRRQIAEATESWTHTVSLMDLFLREPAPERR